MQFINTVLAVLHSQIRHNVDRPPKEGFQVHEQVNTDRGVLLFRVCPYPSTGNEALTWEMMMEIAVSATRYMVLRGGYRLLQFQVISPGQDVQIASGDFALVS